MNLLDTASLVVTPNGYKASKLYSIVPSDGTGDMTFARTGDTATRVNSSGLIETVLANKPRLDYLGSTCPKLLLEPQRTNSQTYSDDFSQTKYTKSDATISTNVAISPDGTTNADKLVESNTNAAHFIYATCQTGVNQETQISIFAKAAERTQFMLWESAITNAQAVFNLSNGTITSSSNGNSSNLVTTTPTITNYGNGWYRCTLNYKTSTGGGTMRIQLYNLSPSYSGNGNDGIYIYGFQEEINSTYATSYIPTTTASVTRNEDVCSKTSATALIGQTEGTMFWDGIISNAGSNVILNLTLNGTNDRYLEITTGLQIRYIEYSTTTQANIATVGNYVTLGNRYKIAAAYKANDFVLYVNGVQIGTDTSGTVFAADKIYNGYYTSGFQGLIKNNSIALWKTRLTNQELVTLTSL